MIKIKSDQEKELSFDLEIFGSANVPDVRLIMETSKSGIHLMFPATMEGATAKINIPKLNNILGLFEERVVGLKLETILDGNHSVIWEDNHVEIEVPVKVTAKAPEIQEKKPEKKAIKVKMIGSHDIEDPEEKKKSDLEKKEIKDSEKEKIKKSMKEMLMNNLEDE